MRAMATQELILWKGKKMSSKSLPKTEFKIQIMLFSLKAISRRSFLIP